MNSLAQVLTQKIANDFMTNYEAVAFGSVNHIMLRQLLGSHYRMKGRIQYQIIADRSAGVAYLCEMPREFTNFDGESEYRTIAQSQPLTFSLNQKKNDVNTNDEIDHVVPHSPPDSLAFSRIEPTATTTCAAAVIKSYRIGSEIHIRLSRSYEPRKAITEVWDKPQGQAMDSEDEVSEMKYYHDYRDGDVNDDDGREGRPHLAHFNFLPATVKQLDISSTIFLSPQVTMSTLHRVESLTLGTLWPWQLTPTSASSYWPPQLKRLKWKHWFIQNLDPHNADSSTRLFDQFDARTITFPSTLTELELPKWMYDLFDDEQHNQLSEIQYPHGLVKLIHPLLPYSFAGWHLPESLTHVEYQFNPREDHYQFADWQLPSSLLTLRFAEYPTKSTFNRLKHDLTSLRLPATLTHFNFPPYCSIPSDWSHTHLTSFIVHPPSPDPHPPLSSFKLPPTVTRIEFSPCLSVPIVPQEYVWPPNMREVQINTSFNTTVTLPSGSDPLSVGFSAVPADVRLHLPPTLPRLDIRSNYVLGVLAQLRVHDDSLEAFIVETNYPASWEKIVLPRTIKEFIFHGPAVPLPEFEQTHLVTIKLIGAWNRPITSQELTLPTTLRSLYFGPYFNQPLDQFRLPPGLTQLRFGRSFNQSLAPLANQLPPQLRILTFGIADRRCSVSGTGLTHLSSLMSLQLPASLHSIVLPSPSSDGIIQSPLHTNYSAFIHRLQEQVGRVLLIDSKAKEKYV